MPNQGSQSRTAQLPFQQLLKNNDLGIIENPLQRVDEVDLDEDITNFYAEHHLGKVVDLDTLIRAGHVARDEKATIAEGILNEVELRALEKEKTTRFWEESKELKLILLTCFVGSVVQGWAQGAIVGPNQKWPSDFHLKIGNISDDPAETLRKTGDIWRFAATNAIVYFSASSLGAFLCDPMTEIFWGRRGALFVAATTTFASSIGQAYTKSWHALLRGQILTSWQIGTALGIAFAGAIPLIVPGSWRFQISSSFIPAAMLLVLVYAGSESPRWLVKKQRYREAYSVFLRLRENPLLAARDLIHIRAQLNVETILFMRTARDVEEIGNEVPHLDPAVYRRQISLFGYGRRITQLFTIPRVRRATLASFAVMSAQILCGINVFAFLASTIWQYARIRRTQGLWLFFAFGLSNFFFSAIAYWFIDTKGRRFLLMVSLAAMFPLLLAVGFSFEVESNSGRLAAVAIFLILYILAYSPGGGVVPFLYSSEVFPLVLREVGMAWASGVLFMGAGLLTLVVPQLIHATGPTGLLGLFAGLDAFAFILVWLFVPGTERQISTMEDMNYVFGVSTKRHVRYQIKEVAPWYYKRHVRRFNVADMDSLYQYSRLEDRTANGQRGQQNGH
ncbi:uncharacterized protein KY384_001661 [Bacidia gigantensis]|uniref:uncharacterized protein n=1 Tax=Bacidia gigantensis TaxID=2732470 RepID=UPI001D044496|nr:uncharacterized protein KY384_001661 [Bacidia gigantensis]KAG8533920.1 hypothetical protein KY384_001661 [Bacidia gigantensis]